MESLSRCPKAGARIAVAAAAALASAAAAGQQETEIARRDVDAEALRQGFSAERLLDETKVATPADEEIGRVENLLLNEQDRVVALIVEVAGFEDISDTHVAIPWDEAAFEGDTVTVPLTEENARDYTPFRDRYFTPIDVGDVEVVREGLRTASGIWKATDLLDDYAVLESGEGYGYVDDLIFDDDGMLRSVVVNVTEGDETARGPRAYAWSGSGDAAWHPGLDYYLLPYDEAEAAQAGAAIDGGRSPAASPPSD